MMVKSKEKLNRIWKKFIHRFCSKQYIKHLLLMIAITLIAGLILSMLVTRSVTVNDMVIRYTRPPSEELDTEGYSEGTEEMPAEAGTPAEGEAPAEAEPPAGEAAPEDAQISAGE